MRRLKPKPFGPLGLVGRTHPTLLAAAEPIEHADRTIQILAARMRATLVKHHGLAIAAPQVGVGVQLVVTEAWAFANPRITADEASAVTVGREGCLSLPDRWFDVPRFGTVEVVAFDVFHQAVVRIEASDIAARAWQHEADHLAGLLLVGRFPEVSREEA